MTPVATALVVIALAWLVRAMPDILAWCRALAAAIHWGSDPVAFCQAQRQRGRGWFRIAPGSMGGRPSYVVHDPALIASLYAAGNAVISWKTAHYFDYGVFGLSRAWLKRPESYRMNADLLYEVVSNHALDSAAPMFRSLLDTQLDEWAALSSEGTLAMPLQAGFINRHWMIAASKTLFGSDFEADSILPGHLQFDRDFHLVVTSAAAPLPRSWSQRLIAGSAFRGQAKAVRGFAKYLSRGQHVSGGAHFAPVMTKLGETLAPGDAPRMTYTLFWAAIANTSLTMFWTLLFIAQAPSIRDRILVEVKALRDSDDPADLTLTGFPAALPTLKSAIYETMRLCMSPSGARTVERDLVLADAHGKPVVFKEGSFVMLFPAPAWLDDDLLSDARTWKGDRFLDDEGRFRQDPRISVWGGGSGICRGRFLATYEVMYTLMAVFERFDVVVGDMLDAEGTTKSPTMVRMGDEGEMRTPGLAARVGTGVLPPAGYGDAMISLTVKRGAV